MNSWRWPWPDPWVCASTGGTGHRGHWGHRGTATLGRGRTGCAGAALPAAVPVGWQAGGKGREVGQDHRFGGIRAGHEHLERRVGAVGRERGAVGQRPDHPVDVVDAQALCRRRRQRRQPAAGDDGRIPPGGDGGVNRSGGNAGLVGDLRGPGERAAYGSVGERRERDFGVTGPATDQSECRQREGERPSCGVQTWTTVQVNVRVMPGTS